jgi:hypothetical protein
VGATTAHRGNRSITGAEFGLVSSSCQAGTYDDKCILTIRLCPAVCSRSDQAPATTEKRPEAETSGRFYLEPGGFNPRLFREPTKNISFEPEGRGLRSAFGRLPSQPAAAREALLACHFSEATTPTCGRCFSRTL